MVGASSIFFLMTGSAVLTFVTMYLLAQNQKIELKQKNATLNAALSGLQEERAKIIATTDGVFTENSAKTAEIAHLNEEIKSLHASIEQLNFDKQQVTKEYKSLESFVFEGDNKVGIDAFQRIIGRYLSK